MHFDLYAPCSNCPFLREEGIRLLEQRVQAIAGMMLSDQGGTFPCHKTTKDHGSEMRETPESRHCAGAIIFALKQGSHTQMMRIAGRLQLFDPAPFMQDRNVVRAVFSSLREMLATALDR